MKKQTISITDAFTTNIGQAVTADTVAELKALATEADSQIAVITVDSNRGTTKSGALMIDPEDWADTVRAELANEDYPDQDDVESVTATTATDDGKRYFLAVDLPSDEWEFDYSAQTATRYCCEECDCWHADADDAAECCA